MEEIQNKEETQNEEEIQNKEESQNNKDIQNKEEYARSLMKKAELSVKIIKILVSIAGGLAGVLLVYGIIAITVMKDTQAALTGFIVILAFVAAVFVALITMFVYAKVHLTKLKKLN